GAATAAMDSLESPGAAAAAQAASWARQALAAEPLRESSVLLLVQALAAAGDQAGALAAFDQYRNRLAAETGLEPTPQAREMRQRILARHPEGGQPGPTHGRLTRPEGSAGRGKIFLGRER